MKTYHVLARREGDTWTATVTNADGVHTWGQGLRHLHQSVREAIALAEDIDEDSFDLDWEYATGFRYSIRDAAVIACISPARAGQLAQAK